MKKILRIVFLLTAILVTASTAQTLVSSIEGFEADLGGWMAYPPPPDGAATITRVMSYGGTLGVPSSSGDFHAEIFMAGTDAPTPTSNGGAFVRPCVGLEMYPGFGKTTWSVDVYVDPAAGEVGDSWTMQQALTFLMADGTTTYTKTFSFVSKKTGPNTWTLGRKSGTPSPINIIQAGWYTMITEWTETVNGIVDYNYISDGTTMWPAGSSVNVLNKTADRYRPRYMWLYGTDGISKTVAIDNAHCDIENPSLDQNKRLALGQLETLMLAASTRDTKKIEDAIKKINESLDERLWETASTLTMDGHKVFEREGESVDKLKDVEGAEGVIETLVLIDKFLAQIAIDEALRTAGADARKIAKAQEEMSKAADELAKDKRNSAKKAIEDYKKAWQNAMKAMKKPVDD